MVNKHIIVLVFCVLFSFILRFAFVSTIPQGLNRDEAALGYNGYLLSATGKDEWQRSWPLNLESFGDYKLLGYPAVLSVLFKFLPLTDDIVRLPSVLAGTFLPIAVYLLAVKFKLKKSTSLVLAALSVITPVFFFYSRIAFEANLALTVFIFGLSVLLEERSGWKSLSIAAICFLVAVFTYNTPLLLLPFIIVIIPFIKGLRAIRAWWMPVLVLSFIWIGAFTSLSQTFSQKSGITIFSDIKVQVDEFPAYRNQFSGISQSLFGNKYVFYSGRILRSSLNSFSPKFLAISGGKHPWHTLPGWGNINWFELIAFYSGVIIALAYLVQRLIKLRVGTSSHENLITNSWLSYKSTRWLLLLYLLLIATVPSSITTDAPHATRSLFMFVVCLIFTGVFIEFVVDHAKRLKFSAGIIISLILLLNMGLFLPYLSNYINSYGEQSRVLYSSGMLDVVNDVESKYPTQPIAVIDQGGFQYIVLSWYKKIPPDQFFATAVKQLPNRIGFRYGERVLQYHFVDKPEDRQDDEKIYIMWDENQWIVKE